MSENGEIYTASKNFTLPPALTALTNFNSAYTHNTAPVTIGCRAATRWSTRGAGCLRRARVASLDLHRQPFLLLLGLHVPVLHLSLQANLVLVEV